jgi:hypothetical protein
LTGTEISFGNAADTGKDFNYSISNIFQIRVTQKLLLMQNLMTVDGERWIFLMTGQLNCPLLILPTVMSKLMDKTCRRFISGNSIGWYRKHFMVTFRFRDPFSAFSSMEFSGTPVSGSMDFI